MSADRFWAKHYSGIFIISKRFFGLPLSRFKAQLLLTRLVKAEIMPPYYGILINTVLGIPTVPFRTTPWELASFQVRGGRMIFTAFIKR